MICDPCYRGCFNECRNLRCACLECGGKSLRIKMAEADRLFAEGMAEVVKNLDAEASA